MPLDQPRTADAPIPEEQDRLHELEDLFEQAPVPIHWLGLDGTILRANQAALDLLGYTRDEYAGHHLSEFQADGGVPGDLLDRLAAGEPVRDAPIRLRGKDGTFRDLLLDASPYLAGGGVRYSRWFTRDVTAQRLAEEAARWTQERFELAARATQDLMWDWDLAGGEVDWAGATSAFFGTPGEPGLQSQSDYEQWAERVHPDDLAMTEAAARAALASGARSWEHEYRFRRTDGSWARMLERAFIVRDDGGRPVRVVGAMQDISMRRGIQEATTRLAAIITSSADAIIGKTLDGIVTSWNPAAERMFGYTEAEMVGRSIFTLIPESLHAAERELLQRIRRGERVVLTDAERIRKDGNRIYIALSVSPIKDATGVVVGASSIKQEITEKKRAQEELARREERYRALVTATTSVVWTTDPAGRFVEPQPSWQEYTGQAWDEHQGLGWIDALHPDDRPSVRVTWARARETGSFYETEGRVWCAATGGYRHFVARSAPVPGMDGSVREWIGTLNDVEDRWLVEERLRHVEKMESVGRLAGGIAHETNNQMTVVLGTVAFLLRGAPSGEVREDLEQIRRAAENTAAITRQLLAFSRRQVLKPQVVDLNAVVTALLPILRRALGETSRLALRLAPDVGPITADPGQLDQVLLNLALNARDAMPGGGVLAIETAEVVVRETYTASPPGDAVAPGSYAKLLVSDTGEGMDRETLSHVFEPFFTTKGVGEGTGLGLSTVYGIVKQSGGFVSVSSRPGHGTTFEIYLPRALAEADAAEAPPESEGGSSELVLVVEDDSAVRGVLARTLRDYGYTVQAAASGADALALAERLKEAPRLVIADVVMPGMSGGQLAARLAERWPAVPVLFTSGYTAVDSVSRGLADPGPNFIQKPLDPDVLARKVREIIDAARQR
jgi:two-component system, cell cycle sensor histidine kinase and response regulator CckA